MADNSPHTPDEFRAWCTERAIDTIVVGSSDTSAAWIGKRLPLDAFCQLGGEEGGAFSDVFLVLTRDGNDAVEPPTGHCEARYFPRKDNGHPDIYLRPKFESVRVLGWHPGTATVTGTFRNHDGSEVPLAPRNVLRRQVERAHVRRLEPLLGFEYEFYLLHGHLEELERTGYELKPLSPRGYTYQVFRSSVDAELLARLRGALVSASIPVEAINPETGPGQYEINITYDTVMQSADSAFLYKNAIKELAHREGLLATFMAKPRTDWPGSSCHLHQSLRSLDDGQPLLAAGPHLGDLTDDGRHYIAGQLATLREFMALLAPTTNAYKRLIPYSWAGTSVSWGHDNRSTALRVVGSSATARRIEHRVCGADINPYLAMAACLAGGLHGIENNLEPPDPVTGDAYAHACVEPLPRSLGEALDLFEASDIARAAFGDDFVDHYVAMKRYEVLTAATTVTDWEVRTYLETS